jgi:hypothetical protein
MFRYNFNSACVLCVHTIQVIARELHPHKIKQFTGSRTFDEALRYVEEIRIALCLQLGKPPETAWHMLYVEAGLDPASDMNEEGLRRFKKAVQFPVNQEISTLLKKLEAIRCEFVNEPLTIAELQAM